jgi:hypothetical protein
MLGLDFFAAPLRRTKVRVGGCAVSALEIASDPAMLEAVSRVLETAAVSRHPGPKSGSIPFARTPNSDRRNSGPGDTY